MYRLKRVLLITAVLAALLVCAFSPGKRTDKGNISPACIALNDSAASFIIKYQLTRDTTNLRKADSLLQAAIRCDTTYIIAYHNRLVVSNYRKDRATGLACLNRMYILSDHHSSYLLVKGIHLESYGYIDSANLLYRQAYKETRSALADKRRKREREFMLPFFLMSSVLIHGKTTAIKQYDSLQRIYGRKMRAELETAKAFIEGSQEKNYLMIRER